MKLIFVSSPQTEFARERKELCYFVLTNSGFIELIGSTGKGTYYILSKGDTNGPKGPCMGALIRGMGVLAFGTFNHNG